MYELEMGWMPDISAKHLDIAAAKENLVVFGCIEAQRCEASVLVRAVAEWLALAQTAGAPEVGVTRFDVYGEGCV